MLKALPMPQPSPALSLVRRTKISWGWTGCSSTETPSNWGYSNLLLPRATVQFQWILAVFVFPLLSPLSCQLSGARPSLLDSRLILWPACSKAFPQATVGSVPCALPVSRHVPLLLCASSVWTLGEIGYPKSFYAPIYRFFITDLKCSILLTWKTPGLSVFLATSTALF